MANFCFIKWQQMDCNDLKSWYPGHMILELTNIGWGLLLGVTRPLPEPKSTYHELGPLAFTWNITHLGQNKMATTLQMVFSTAFPWEKICVLGLKFKWNLFRRFQLTITHHRFRYRLGNKQATRHYLTQSRQDPWCNVALLVLNEIKIIVTYHSSQWVDKL